MEPMDFDSFVQLINEMSVEKKVESPLSQLSSEELALIKSFDPDLVDEISSGKITPSEAVLLARSATSNQEQEHVVKENDAECADSVLNGLYESAEKRLENNRQEAKTLKEEADQDTEEDPDEGEISDEEWQNALDSKYEEIFNNDKIEINVAEKVNVDPSKSLNHEDSDRIYDIMDNEIPCVFWDDEDWVEQGLLIKIDGYGDFVKDDNTVWAYCAVLDDVKKPKFDPENPLDDVEDHLDEDEIVVEEEMMYTPELHGHIGKIWQGEPTNDFNEAYEVALAECYMREDAEIVIRDSLNRNVLGEAVRAPRARTPKPAKPRTNAKPSSNSSKNTKTSKAGKDGKFVNGAIAGGAATSIGGQVLDKFTDWGKDVVDAALNSMDSLAQQGNNINDTHTQVNNINDQGKFL